MAFTLGVPLIVTVETFVVTTGTVPEKTALMLPAIFTVEPVTENEEFATVTSEFVDRETIGVPTRVATTVLTTFTLGVPTNPTFPLTVTVEPVTLTGPEIVVVPTLTLVALTDGVPEIVAVTLPVTAALTVEPVTLKTLPALGVMVDTLTMVTEGVLETVTDGVFVTANPELVMVTVDPVVFTVPVTVDVVGLRT